MYLTKTVRNAGKKNECRCYKFIARKADLPANCIYIPADENMRGMTPSKIVDYFENVIKIAERERTRERKEKYAYKKTGTDSN